MMLDSSTRYGAVTRFFHWSLTLLVIGMLVLGWVMASFPKHSPLGNELVGVHKSTGVLTLALAVLFILWRLFNRRPSLSQLPPWQRYLAHSTHYLLYLILLAQPVAGLAMVLASGHAVSVYGLFSLDPSGSRNRSLAGGAHLLHTEIIPWLIVALVALHVAGALYHQFVRHDGILRRMLSGAAGQAGHGDGSRARAEAGTGPS